MKVLILAGGFATRLWPLTESRAKPLLVVDGKTILAHVLESVTASHKFKPEDIFLLTNSKFEKDFKTELSQLGLENTHVFCEEAFADGEKLGALGAISVAIEHFRIDESILVLAGDNILSHFDASKMLCEDDESVLTVRTVEDPFEARKFGVVELNSEGCVVGFEEKPEHPKSLDVSAGFMSFGKNLLSLITHFAKTSPDALGGIFPEILRNQKRVRAYKTQGHWFDVGSFDTYLEAHKALQSEKRESVKNNNFSGKVYVSDTASVKNSTLIDTIVYPGTKIENCRLSNCVIDQNCILSGVDLNRKLVRQNTHLAFQS